MAELNRGKSATITKGQYAGQEAEADLVIPRAVCPELQNQVMNLELIPASLMRAKVGGKTCVVEYEPDSELRDFEQIPLLEEGGIEAFIRREVLPYTPDAWLVEADTKIGYEVSFTRHFYQPPQLRTLAQISADILALEQETEGLLLEITKGATA
jgi:hypothetical protein